MSKRGLVTLAVATLIASSFAIAAPAAAAPAALEAASVRATAPSEAQAPGSLTIDGAVHPNYAAGAYFWVCVSPNGSTVTVLYQEKTMQVCNGAAAIQQWLDSGQFVQTIQLTTAGYPATATFNPSEDCFLALVGDTALLITPADITLVFTGSLAAITTGRSCISN